MEECEHFVVANRSPQYWMWSISDTHMDLYDMEEPVIKMATERIKLLHAQILDLTSKGVLQEHRHQSADDLADTLERLKALSSTATARVLGKIHVNEKKEVGRITKLR